MLAAPAAGSAHAAVVVNEIMYNSIESSDVEYVELYNTGPGAVDLTGWYLLDDVLTHDRCFLAGTLAPGAYLVVPGFTSLFQSKYPGVTNLNPNQFDSSTVGRGFSLGNGGDQVRVYDPLGVLVDFVPYKDIPPWPTAPDGAGPSLELYHPALDNEQATNWGASTNAPPDGTPGSVNSIFRNDRAPLVQELRRSVPLPASTDTVTVTARVTDDQGLTAVQLFVDEGAGFAPRTMFDDGAHGDGGPGDTVWGASIAPHADGTRVRYYVSARDTLPQTSTSPAGAPAEYDAYRVGHRLPELVVNELVARNVAGIVDEAGQREDWVEVRNRGPVSVDLSGMFLSDKRDLPRLWPFPAGTNLASGARILVWCDSDTAQGPLHTPFKLSANGGRVLLSDRVDDGNVVIHEVAFGPTGPDVAFGFLPEIAGAPEYLAAPTPLASNDSSSYFSTVVINEFQTTSAAGGVDDWVELHNRGASAVDIGGWHVSDDVNLPLRYTFPPGTVIPGGAYLVVDEIALGFGFASDGSDEILLVDTDGTTGRDFFDPGPQSPDVSQGRLPNGRPYWRFFSAKSPGFANACSGGPFLAGVSGLRLTSRVRLEWLAVLTAAGYDVVRGNLFALLAAGGDFAASSPACVENDGADTASWDATTPGPGGAFYYLVRATGSNCSTGSWNDGTERASRDPGLTTAGCP